MWRIVGHCHLLKYLQRAGGKMEGCIQKKNGKENPNILSGKEAGKIPKVKKRVFRNRIRGQ